MTESAQAALCALPLAALLPRAHQAWRFRALLRRHLPEAWAERETHRTLYATLAAFSFTALLALVTLAPDAGRIVPIWYLLLSFTFYFGALNLQGYKNQIWHDLLGDALRETAGFSLLAAIVVSVQTSSLTWLLAAGALGVTSPVWGLDLWMRVRSSNEVLRNMESRS